MTPKTKELLRSLPGVSTLLEHEEVKDWLHGLPRSSVVASLQRAIETARRAILLGTQQECVEPQELLASAEAELVKQSTPSLRRVVNATGIVLHTGLGRAPLSPAAVEAIVEGASEYCNIEYDLQTGQRGKRTAHVTEHLKAITGAQAAAVVNNNAAAVLLILQTFASGREVLLSRGQLIEIGGSFRLPDIMRASGAILREVGTTNRTRITDYEQAIGDATSVLMHVHTSNYRIVGFTQEVSIKELAELAHRHGRIAVDDLGSGALLDMQVLGLPDEPSVQKSLEAGADLVCFSGDKLLGGPQCGIILGRQDLIEQLHANPLMRTYRVDKLTLLALEATLRAYLDPKHAVSEIPTLAMLSASADELAKRGSVLCEQLKVALPEESFFVGSDVSYAGGGSLPDRPLQTVVVQWRPANASVDSMLAALRGAEVPVIARIRDDAVCFDLRTLFEDNFDDLVASVHSAVWDQHAEDSGDGLSLPIL